MNTRTERVDSRDLVRPPSTWKDPASHFSRAMDDRWYEILLTVYDAFFSATVDFWRSKDVKCALLPLTTGSISSPMGLGSDSSPVRVEIAEVETYLADSQQFALEYGCRLWPKGCFYIMPSFRGELNDDRHLGQFFHSEAEVPGSLDDLMVTIEEYVRYLVTSCLHAARAEIREAAGSLRHAEALADGTTEFKRITFEEAARLLESTPDGISSSIDGSWRTLTRYGERALLDLLGDFLWVTNFDELAVPFYQATDSAAGGTRVARNADMLFGIGETVGAGERHETAEQVIQALARHAISPEEYEWYTEMRRIRPMRTSGFGIGLERFVMWLLRHDDIRDMQLLVRANGYNIVP